MSPQAATMAPAPDLLAACEAIAVIKEGRSADPPDARWDVLEASRKKLIAAFCAQHGWEWDRRGFSAAMLAEGRSRFRPGEDVDGWIDHDDYFRHPDGAPAAVTTQTYRTSGDVIEEATELAAERGLAVSFPDFPSWRAPGKTMLILFTPLREPDRGH